ncbi:MAG: efflux RND transporter permease subunit [Richelia sp.]|nr:efflux RND transporter permease subunit [Richelia sp.]
MLASTLTTVAVFPPIVLVTGEAGQLFVDIGIGLSASVLFSLFAALTLVPILSGLFLNRREAEKILQGMGNNSPAIDQLELASDQIIPNIQYRRVARKSFISRIFAWLNSFVTRISEMFLLFQRRLEQVLLNSVNWSLGIKRKGRRLVVLAIPITLIFVSLQLLPPADYLPEGNRNLILCLAEPFAGTSIPEAISLSEAARNFASQQPEVMRTLYIQRPGLKAIAACVKAELATGRTMDSMVGRFRQAGANFPGYPFMVPIRASIFR